MPCSCADTSYLFSSTVVLEGQRGGVKKMGGDYLGVLSALIYTCLRNSLSVTGLLLGHAWNAAFYGCAMSKGSMKSSKVLGFECQAAHTVPNLWQCSQTSGGRGTSPPKQQIIHDSQNPCFLGLKAESCWCKTNRWKYFLIGRNRLLQSKSLPSKS